MRLSSCLLALVLAPALLEACELPGQQPAAQPPPAQPYAVAQAYPQAPYGAPPRQQMPYAQQAPYPQQAPPQQPPPYAQQPPYVQPSYPPTPYAPPSAPPAPAPQPAPAPVSPPPAPAPAPPGPAPSYARPMLGPLFGPLMWQAEARAVARELVSNLSPANQALVASIPLVFDPSEDVNAFAGCDDGGAPFVAGTEGLLEAIDAISQTKATDERYGSRTYDAYVSAVAPALVSQQGGSALLPPGIVPAVQWLDVARISRAHEIFDEMVAFTFGHELSHHYLGHTGCAHGQPPGVPPALSSLGRLVSSALPGLNQPNEVAADTSGCINVLDSGRARAAQAYRWNEEGALWLLDFFSRLERASGASPLLGFLRTHPNPSLRLPVVQGVAATWHLQHSG
jgi:hypothetical protein